MSYKNLLNKIDELRVIVGGWDGTTPSQLDKDIALDRIKKIYELLRFQTFEEPTEEQVEVEVERVEHKEVLEPIQESIQEPIINEAAETEEEVEEEEEEMILDIDTLKSASKERYNKILSLYCDLETQEPIITEEQKAAPNQVVEEVTTTTTTTIKTTASTGNNTELYKISSQLGINDRFLLANDLFGGDMSALSDALLMFDSFTNIDDVMVYIAENYNWGGDSDGAKLLFTLLQNRFL
ncbi:MAG: hypothetical protein SNH55_06080 [Rikenellaceae bacterium]